MKDYTQALESLLTSTEGIDAFRVSPDEGRKEIRVRYAGNAQQARLFLKINTNAELAKLRPSNCSLVVYKVNTP